MKIGIIGAGAIGSVLARKFSANGHKVVIANSKGPETISNDTLVFGAKAGVTKDAVSDTDVLIISIPFVQITAIAETVKNHLSTNTIIIDTGNYYPVRDGEIDEIIKGKPESTWVAEQLGKPVAKAWNIIPASMLKNNGYPSGMESRLAVPFFAESEHEEKIVLQLIEETGFDPLYAGNLSESYRIQPGQPSYSTALTLKELQIALENSHTSAIAAANRDQFMKVMTSLAWPEDVNSLVEISRFLNK
ncbi:MAG: prephenate dehydrogenase/arogenate dehydrogenase family protein [Flavobacteriales bacterium]|nr:MAG: prephenate dehydrogenase/arogenate dehydrogenase family protein [Flavobacteriales bacterium]